MSDKMGICHTDLTGKVLEAQTFVCRTLEMREADLKSQSIYDFWPQPQIAARHFLVSTLIETGRPYCIVSDYIAADRSARCVDLTVNLVKDKKGNGTGLIGLWQELDGDQSAARSLCKTPVLKPPVAEYIASMLLELSVLSDADSRLRKHLLSALRIAMQVDYEGRTAAVSR